MADDMRYLGYSPAELAEVVQDWFRYPPLGKSIEDEQYFAALEESIADFVLAVRKRERERCANVAEVFTREPATSCDHFCGDEIAERIRGLE